MQLNMKESTMNRHDTDSPPAGMYMLGAFALGALAMYLLDPVQGNRRRALVRDKTYSYALHVRKRADARSRDIANRARGVSVEVRHAASALKDVLAGARSS
jgi:hypothetical protein